MSVNLSPSFYYLSEKAEAASKNLEGSKKDL